MNPKFILHLLITCTFAPLISLADLTLASPFTDNAILQREVSVPVWGTAEEGAEVSVEFAGQKKGGVADEKGNWKVLLDPLQASFESRTLKISEGQETLTLDNILVGEVWICSGQSNMQMEVARCPDIVALTSSAKNLRTFEVKRTVSFTEESTCEGAWTEQNPHSAVAFSFAYFLEKPADVPVGIILTCWGSSSIEAWMPADMVDTVPHFKTLMEDFQTDKETREQITAILEGPKPWKKKEDVFLRRQSNIIYNAMMHPLAPFACRGLVWYQGERNTQSMQGMKEKPWFAKNSGMLQYGHTLQEWIKRYRKEWHNEEMEFLIVMLPGYGKSLPISPDQNDPESVIAHSWAWMRESQLKALELPHTAVVNTIDLGDIKDVHPKDKLPIGQRLALLAEQETLGKMVDAFGPMLNNVEVKDGKIIVHFNNADGLMTIDGESPSGFWISGSSEEWARAEAEIKGNSVVLHSPEIENPEFVRYAFAGKPTVNLVNKADLPTYPFRTDKFPPREITE